MISTLACLAALLPAVCPQTSGGDHARVRMARAIKVIPVSHLVSALPEPDGLPFGTLIGCAPGYDRLQRNLLRGGDGEQERRIADLAQRLRDLTPLAWSDGHCTVDLVGDALIVTGAPDQIHLVEQSLQKLAACVGEPFTIRAAAFSVEQGNDLPAVAPSYTALRGKLAELGAQIHWESSTTAAPGQIVALGVRRANQYVMDLEVEIAQASTMPNPVPATIELGSALLAQAHPLTGSGDAVLFVQYAHGETAAAMRTFALGKDDNLPRLESPTVAIDFGTMSGRIPSGGALLVQLEGSWAGRRFGLVVGAERAPTPAAVEREVGVFPLGAFLAAALRSTSGTPIPEFNPWVWSPPLVVNERESDQIDPSDAEAWGTLLRQALGDDESNVEITDGLAYVRGSAVGRETVARFIEQLQEQFLATVEVDCRLETEPERQVVQRLRFPALLGRHHVAVHGVESTAVADCDVEVAQKSGISDPKVVRHFSGTECRLRVFPLPGHDLGSSAQIRVVDTVPTRTYVPENELGVPIEQPTVTQVQHHHAGRVPADGTAVDLGQGPPLVLEQRTRSTRQIFAVKRR